MYPTRTARFGQALVPTGTIRLKAKEFAAQTGPVEEGCPCSCCAYYSRAFLHVAFKEGNALAAQLLTKHNISYMMRLMRTMRQVRIVSRSIVDGSMDGGMGIIYIHIIILYSNCGPFRAFTIYNQIY